MLRKYCEPGEMLGLTLGEIKGCEKGSESVWFIATDGRRFRMHYVPD